MSGLKEIKVNLDETYFSDLVDAVKKGSLCQLRILLHKGNDINKQNAKGKTALMFAAAVKNKEMINELLRTGADVNLEDKKKRTALMYAAKNGCEDNIKLLIDNKAKIEAKDAKLKTAVTYAIENKHQSCADLLNKPLPPINKLTPTEKLIDSSNLSLNKPDPNNYGAAAQQGNETAAENAYLRQNEIARLAKMIGGNWRGLFLELQFTDIEIDDAFKCNNQDKKETVISLLLEWSRRHRDMLTKQDVLDALDTAAREQQTHIDWSKVNKLLA